MAGGRPQEFRLTGIMTVEGGNQFLRDRYIREFNARFTMPAAEKGTAFRRTSGTDLNWIFTLQTERLVAKDNTVAIGSRSWQLDKTRFRHSLKGGTVTIHEHLDETISICFGPHVVGRFVADGSVRTNSQERGGKGGGSRRLKPKPDRSRVDQTGPRELLTTSTPAALGLTGTG